MKLTPAAFFLFSSHFLLVADTTLGQKRIIDHSVYNTWPHVGTEAISNNGNYAYWLETCGNRPPKLIFQATKKSWKQIFNGGNIPTISEDSRLAIFTLSPYTLVILELGTEKRQILVK